jgi:hypothetical protein
MKKLIFALLIVSLLPLAAFSQALPPPEHEVASWWWNPDTEKWEQQSSPADPNPTALGRLYAQDADKGACNKDFVIDVKITAEVAQWIDWTISGTHWKWFVRKPGNYGGDCITGWMASNQNVALVYEGFEPLKYVSTGDKKSVVDTIPIWYAAGDFVTPPPKGHNAWVYCRDMAARNDTIFDSAALHAGIQWKLWNYIHVIECNSACKYEDDATITLRLCCQKPWIQRATGFFEDYKP